jgi:hypothetical protein
MSACRMRNVSAEVVTTPILIRELSFVANQDTD